MELSNQQNLLDLYLYLANRGLTKSRQQNKYFEFSSSEFGWPNAILIDKDENVTLNDLTQLSGLIINEHTQTVVLTPSVNINIHQDVIKQSPYSFAAFWISMYKDIHAEYNPEELPAVNDSRLEIKSATSEKDLMDCIETLNNTLFQQDKLNKQYIEKDSFGEDITWLMGSVDNRVITTLMIYFDKATHIAGIYNVCTQPEYRNMGIGKAMMKCAFIEILLNGTNKAVLQSTDMGKKLYSGLGFIKDGYYGLLTKR